MAQYRTQFVSQDGTKRPVSNRTNITNVQGTTQYNSQDVQTNNQGAAQNNNQDNNQDNNQGNFGQNILNNHTGQNNQPSATQYMQNARQGNNTNTFLQYHPDFYTGMNNIRWGSIGVGGIDPSGAAAHLKQQSQDHLKQAAQKGIDTQRERRIANQDNYAVTDREELREAASKQNQEVAKAGGAGKYGTANATLNRTTATRDVNVNKQRADAAAAKANEYDNQKWSNVQEATRRHQNAQAANYRYNDMVDYNQQSDYLSMGGRPNGTNTKNPENENPETKDEEIKPGPPPENIKPETEDKTKDTTTDTSGMFDPQDVINALLGFTNDNSKHANAAKAVVDGTGNPAAVKAYKDILSMGAKPTVYSPGTDSTTLEKQFKDSNSEQVNKVLNALIAARSKGGNVKETFIRDIMGDLVSTDGSGNKANKSTNWNTIIEELKNGYN